MSKNYHENRRVKKTEKNSVAGLPRDFINDIEVLHIEDYERTNPYCRNRRSQRDQKPERINKKKNDSEELKSIDGHPIWYVKGQNQSSLTTSQDGQFPSQNEGRIKFEKTKIPVIFVLGGPGSGKVTHCDTLASEKRGIIHINMTDLLQQYMVGSGEIKDFNQLSSRTVAEVLMLEMKMSPAAKTILISGYPRNMRDVVEYTDKIKVVSGVIVLSWKLSSLERQIEYGAKLGHVILSLAKMELNNFYKNVIPVVDFYDQRKMLISINGERNPQEVYNDFRVAVLRIIGSFTVDSESVSIPNGRVGFTQQLESISTNLNTNSGPSAASITTANVSVHKPPTKGYPTVVYIIGGPGSNKATLIQKVLGKVPGWTHISMGGLLRSAMNVNSEEYAIENIQKLKDTITAGEMVDKDTVNQILEKALLENINANGVFLDGFPRDLDQLRQFENKYEQHPPMILLDCSKLQLSRGRWDDSIAAFRKRLEVFKEKTLPMLKVVDTENRLTMVDGDTETPEVQEAFTVALLEAIRHAQKDFSIDYDDVGRTITNLNFEAAILQDLEDDQQAVNKQKHYQMNGFGPPKERERIPIQDHSNPVSISHAATALNVVLPQENTFKTNAQVKGYP